MNKILCITDYILSCDRIGTTREEIMDEFEISQKIATKYIKILLAGEFMNYSFSDKNEVSSDNEIRIMGVINAG